MPVFLDDLITPFYERIGGGFRQAYRRGRVFRVPVGYTFEHRELWRPVQYDESRTSASSFRIVASPADAFARDTPLASPQLATNEEFIVVRAKRRPVILLSPSPVPPEVAPVRRGGRVHRKLALVVPISSVVDGAGRLKFQAGFLERVRMLEFEQFLYLPPFPS